MTTGDRVGLPVPAWRAAERLAVRQTIEAKRKRFDLALPDGRLQRLLEARFVPPLCLGFALESGAMQDAVRVQCVH